MYISEIYVRDKAISVINSITRPNQAVMAQKYLYLLINKLNIYNSLYKVTWIFKIRDMLEIKLHQFM